MRRDWSRYVDDLRDDIPCCKDKEVITFGYQPINQTGLLQGVLFPL